MLTFYFTDLQMELHNVQKFDEVLLHSCAYFYSKTSVLGFDRRLHSYWMGFRASLIGRFCPKLTFMIQYFFTKVSCFRFKRRFSSTA